MGKRLDSDGFDGNDGLRMILKSWENLLFFSEDAWIKRLRKIFLTFY
jgi:hypothetical protein